uniref:Uncharacterized protein n=1 Tax=Tanacetum cinerariifolium TaxID=118510 RepID=A0A6L2LEG9_TANCI|nr:hypothetical protein [Tanacetum cinerariifolium]
MESNSPEFDQISDIEEQSEEEKWHNGTSSRSKSTETSDGLAVIQAQLNNLEREIKKVNEKVYTAQDSVLHFGVAFCVLRFGFAFWFCVLPRTQCCILVLRFVSCDLALRFGCVLSQDSLRFVSRLVTFCHKTRCVLSQDSLRFFQDSLRFVTRLVAFCLKTHCILSQDSLCFVSRLVAFYPKTRCVLSQDSLRFVSRLVAFCLLRFVNRPSLRLALPLQLTFHVSTQQDIYAAGFKNRPPMLNKDNYVPWSSRIIRYARSRPNGKMIVDFIENGPYVRRMIATPGEPDFPVLVPESFHEQTDEELTENDIKRMDADD